MSESKTHFDIYHYLGIIKRRKWFFIIPLIVIYAGFLASSIFLPKVYEAKAIILVEEKNVVNPLLKNLAVSTTVASRLNTLKEEILSWPRLFQLVERLGLNKNITDQLDLERLIAGIRKNISLKMKSKEIVVISYRGKDPKSTQKLVNTLCDILIQRNLSLQSEDTESAIDFINKQLNIYKGKLNKSEEALRKFKEVYGLGLTEKPSVNVGSAAGSTQNLPDSASPVGVTLAKINKEIANAQADLVMASVDCTPEHPRVKNLKNRIQSLKEKRDQYIKQLADNAGVKPDSYVSIADSFPRQQEEMTRLSRDKAINERIYAMLLERYESAKITERLDNSDNRTKFRIIEPARLPLFAVKPNKIKFNILGIIVGGMTGFGFVYLLEYADSSFAREEDLKKSFGYPVLGNISKIITEDDLKHRNRFARKITFIIIAIIILMVLILWVVLQKDAIMIKLHSFYPEAASSIAQK